MIGLASVKTTEMVMFSKERLKEAQVEMIGCSTDYLTYLVTYQSLLAPA